MLCPKLYKRVPSGESADDGWRRLSAEDRFQAKKTRQAEYESEGETAKDAHEMALNDFQPLEEDPDPIEVVDPDEAAGSPDPAEVDLSTPDALRDADWVYSNLNPEGKGLSRKDAPSQAAHTMLQDFGKSHSTRIKFYEKVLEPLLKRARVGESYSDDGRELIALCVRKRAEFAAEAAREEAEAA